MNHKISWVERDPQSLRWDPRRCPPSPVFSCLCLNVLTPFARLWGSADPLLSQVSFLTSWILPQTFSAGLSSSLLGLIFHSQPVCSISPACLIWQLPDQGIPAALAGVAWLLLWCQSQNWSNPSPSAPQPVCCCLAEHTQLCVQPQSKQDQGWGQQMPGMHQRAPLGCWQGRALAAWSSLDTKLAEAAEGGTAGCAATAHSSSLTSEQKGLQPRCWTWRLGEFTKPFLWTLSSLLTPQLQKGSSGHLL